MKVPKLVRAVPLAFFFLPVSTTPLLANAGSFFLIPSLLQLLIGNIIFGLLEMFVIQKIFKTPKSVSSYGIIILANYVSMIFGYVLAIVTPAVDAALPVLLAVLFAASVFVEWPFFAWAVKERFLGFSRKILKYSFVAQCISYAFLIPMYFLTFDTGSITNEDHLRGDLMNLSANAYQYRIRPTSLGGGGGEYTGYEIPTHLSRNENGIYSAIVVRPDTVEFLAQWFLDPSQTMSVRIDAMGRPLPDSWVAKGEFIESEEIRIRADRMSICCFAASGTRLFAGAGHGGFFRSTDNGETWAEAHIGLTDKDVRSLAVLGSDIFAGTLGDGIFTSTDNGTSWTAVNTGLTNRYVHVLTARGTNLFAAAFDGPFITSPAGVFLSTDKGKSWTPINTGLTNTTVRSFAFSGVNFFAATYGGVFLSTDNGTNWSAVNSGLTNMYVHSLAVLGTHVFAGTGGAGVFISTNHGTNWTAVNTGLEGPYVYALAGSGTNLFAGTPGDGVFRSTNRGRNWTGVNMGLTNMSVDALTVSGTSLFVVGSGRAFRSTNKGESWSPVEIGLKKAS